ncbi:hypothetical protein [Granulicella sibirica]|nr:hypothetical protein [Granulicella sibirica]
MLDNALWAAGFAGHVALVLVLAFRKRAGEYPIFTGMMGFQALTTILLFVISRHASHRAYFLAYWITGFADYVFQVALIYEIARDILRPTGTWVRDARNSFLVWGMIGLVAAAGLALQLGPPQSRGLALWNVRVTVFTSLLTCELFLAMSAAANRLGLQRRSYVVALGQGIAIWAFSALLEEFAHVILGWDREFVVFSYLRMGVYLSVLGFWIVTFCLPEKARAPLSPEMSAYLVALHRRVQYDLTSVDGPPL